MATTRIMPLHIGKGRTESQAISDIIDYVANPQKTDNGKLITGYGCDRRTADAEFLLAKRQYIAATGRVRGADDVIAYHVRQSFKPGEITPEEANRLGVEFAKRFTKGNHVFVVCTHIDKSHIHNHIIWSAVNADCDRKFRNFWGSTRAVRRLSDTICIENGLSIVEDPNPHGKSYNKWLGDQAKPSHREQLRVMIDRAVLAGEKQHTPRKKSTVQPEPPKVKDLQAEYAKLLEEKKKTYAEYRRSREEMRRGKSRQDFSLCGPSVLTPALLAAFVLTFIKITAALLSIRPLKLPSEYHLHSYPHLLRHLSEHPHA